jgi:hypothetical protein
MQYTLFNRVPVDLGAARASQVVEYIAPIPSAELSVVA